MLRHVAAATVVSVTLLACSAPDRETESPQGAAAIVEVSPTATASPSPSASTEPTSPPTTPAPTPTATGSSPLTPRPLGDLTIVLDGACSWYLDAEGGLWLNPTLSARWTGPAPWPPNAFSMLANVGTRTAGGLVPESTGFDTDPDPRRARFTWAIGGEAPSVFAGKTVTLTVRIDVVGPTGEVPETNESNNTLSIDVAVPATGYSTSESTIPCTSKSG